MSDVLTEPQQRIPNLQRDVVLAPFTYIKIGGPASFFVQTSNADELASAVQAALEVDVPFRVIGGGANVLILDTGFDGLVIRNVSSAATFDGTRVTVDSGYNLTKLASDAAARGLSGLEFAFGIPGTVGGAIYGNAGAFDKEMKDVVREVTLLRTDGTIVTIPNEALQFMYRHSVLKDDYAIVLSAVMELSVGDMDTIKALHKERLHYRKEHQPLEKPSLGSVFKNVLFADFPEAFFATLDVAGFRDKGFIPAGYINDKLGLRGKQVGGAQLSEKHGNFIINAGGATAADVLALVAEIKDHVRAQLGGLQLHEEIQLLGS